MLACALVVEERAARKGGARVTRVGLGATLVPPEEPFIALGLAGALVPGLRPGTVLTATRVVDAQGQTVWEGQPLAITGAEPAVICSAHDVVDDPDERAALARRTGAVAVDMESAKLAATGRLAGVVRAISDTPERPIGRLARAATADGRVDWGAAVASFVREPVKSLRAAAGARRGLASLERAAAALAVSADRR